MAREGGAGHGGGAVPPERLDSAARGCGVRQSHIPGALSILKGAVPDRARGLGHMAPTYFRREPGIALRRPSRLRTSSHLAWRDQAWPALSLFNGACCYRKTGSHPGSSPGQAFSGTCASGRRYSRRVTTSPIALAKSNLRKAALARRDALPAAERTAAAETLAARPF